MEEMLEGRGTLSSTFCPVGINVLVCVSGIIAGACVRCFVCVLVVCGVKCVRDVVVGSGTSENPCTIFCCCCCCCMSGAWGPWTFVERTSFKVGCTDSHDGRASVGVA